MTYTSFPFDFLPDGVTQQEVREDDGSELFRLAIPDGVDGWPGSTAMQVTPAAGGTAVSVAPGTAGVRGFVIVITAAEQVPVPGADAQTRVDRVTLRLDRSANTLKPFLVPGTPGAGAPAFTRDSNTWDLPLYQVTRSTTGALSVKDERDWRDARFQLCESTNRPSFPRFGDFAFETDTLRLIRYDGATWRVWFGPEDTGEIALEAGGFWKISPGLTIAGRRLNGWVRVRIALTRTTNTLHTSDTDGSPLLTPLPPSLRPNVVEYGRASLSGRSSAELIINTSGEANLFSITEDIPVGGTLRCSMTYPGA